MAIKLKNEQLVPFAYSWEFPSHINWLYPFKIGIEMNDQEEEEFMKTAFSGRPSYFCDGPLQYGTKTQNNRGESFFYGQTDEGNYILNSEGELVWPLIRTDFNGPIMISEDRSKILFSPSDEDTCGYYSVDFDEKAIIHAQIEAINNVKYLDKEHRFILLKAFHSFKFHMWDALHSKTESYGVFDLFQRKDITPMLEDEKGNDVSIFGENIDKVKDFIESYTLSEKINQSEGMWGHKPYTVTDVIRSESGDITSLKMTNSEGQIGVVPVKDGKITFDNKSFDIQTGKVEAHTLKKTRNLQGITR